MVRWKLHYCLFMLFLRASQLEESLSIQRKVAGQWGTVLGSILRARSRLLECTPDLLSLHLLQSIWCGPRNPFAAKQDSYLRNFHFVQANVVVVVKDSVANVSKHQIDPSTQQHIGSNQVRSQQTDKMAGGNQHAQLGATFYPGGYDDFYMPEVVSPTPQRYA